MTRLMPPSAPLLFALAALAAFASPLAGLVLAGAALFAQIGIFAIHTAGALLDGWKGSGRQNAAQDAATDAGKRLFFSVHVATHNEPPRVVIRTVEALAAQAGFGDYEVIVIDNNTRDEAMWRPVEAFCRGAGPRIRFLHRMGVEGAKSGALDIALAEADARTTHVVTVDADYEARADFLAAAARALRAYDVDFVQFPQAYRHTAGTHDGVSLELADYFRRHARQANVASAMLLTGTLSVVSKEALEAAGGWRARTITEDAELGVRLCAAGFRGRFVDDVVGRGLLPLSYKSLETQRYRWASGNLRTLLDHVFAMRGSLGQRVLIASQLTAWTNLALVPAAVLLGGALRAALTGRPVGLGALTASLVLALILIGLAWPLYRSAGTSASGRSTFLKSLAARLSLAPASALATMDAALDRPQRFKVTNKSLAAIESAPLSLAALASFAAAVLVGVASAALASPALAVGAVCLALPLPASMIVHRDLARYGETLAAAEGLA